MDARRLFVIALVIALGVALLGAIAPPRDARAEETPEPSSEAPAEIVLDAVVPAAPELDGSLSLRGRFSNTGDADLVDPVVVLRLDQEPLVIRDEIRRTVQEPLYRYGTPDYRFVDRHETLGPGETAEFSLEVPLPQLGLTATGVYVMGIDLLATLPTGLRPFVASARTTVPIRDVPDPQQDGTDGPKEAAQRVDVALLWRLADRPALLPDGRLLNRRLERRLAPGNALANLVESAADTPATWLIDPDLVVTARRMTEPYEVVGREEEDQASPAAEEWLDLLQETIRSSDDVRVTPYAEPDVPLMLAGGLTQDMATKALAAAVLDTGPVAEVVGSDVSSLSYPRGGWLDPTSTAVFADAGVRHLALLGDGLVTAQGASATTNGPSAQLEGGQQHTPAVHVIDPGLYAVLADPPPTGVDEALSVRQLMLAETFMANQADEQTLLMAVPHGWDVARPVMDAVIDTFRGTDWIRPIRLRSIETSPDPVTTVAQSPTELPPLEPADVPGRVVALQDDVERIASLVTDPAETAAAFERSGHRALSTAWRVAPERGRTYTSVLSDGLSGASALVGVSAPEEVTLSSRTGQFPITIVNDLSAEIIVQLRLEPSNVDRLTLVDPEPAVLQPGEKATLLITAQAAGNGRVPVSAWLETTDGQAVGQPVTLVVVATHYGLVGWAIVGLALVVLLATAVRRMRGNREEAS